MKKVLGISFGRKMGNTDVMVKTALMECEKAGCQVKFLRGDDLDIKPCTGCISCVVGMTTDRGKGGCPVKDDFHILDEALMECDAVIVGSPTYVLSPTGKFKVACDRIGPSHDITFRKATYEEGLAAGKSPDQLPDPRSFKKRIGALISVGGAMTKNWLAFMLPTMYEFTMSMGIAVTDSIGMKHLVRALARRLDNGDGCDMLHAVLKIYGVLQRARPQDGIDIGLQFDL